MSLCHNMVNYASSDSKLSLAWLSINKHGCWAYGEAPFLTLTPPPDYPTTFQITRMTMLEKRVLPLQPLAQGPVNGMRPISPGQVPGLALVSQMSLISSCSDLPQSGLDQFKQHPSFIPRQTDLTSLTLHPLYLLPML